MPIAQATKDKLKKLGLDPDKLEAAAKDEKAVEVDIPEGQLFTAEQLQTRDANNKAEGKKEGEKEGETKGKELAAKAIKKKFGIESETKDIDKVAEEIEAKAKLGDPGLKAQVDSLLKEKETLTGRLTQAEEKAQQLAFDTELIGMFPANRGADLTDTERLALVKMNLQFEKTDNGTIVKRNGAIVQDEATKAPLPVNKVIETYFTEKKWVSEGGPGGRGGGDTPPSGGGGKPMTYSQAEAEWKKANPGKEPIGVEFTDYLGNAAKEPGFDMNK